MRIKLNIIKVISVIISLLYCGNIFSQDESLIKKFNYMSMIQYNIININPNSITIEIVNNNKDIYSEEGRNPEDYIVLAAPDSEFPQISWLSYEFAAYNKGNFVKNIISEKDDQSIKIPNAAEFFKYNYEGLFRNIRVISLKYESKKNIITAGTNYIVALKKCRFEIKFKTSSPPLNDEQKRDLIDPYTKRIAEAAFLNGKNIDMFINPEVKSSLDVAPQKEWFSLLKDNLTTNTVVKAKIFSPGVHRLDYDSLKSCGLTPENLKPKYMRLYSKGKEMPIYIKSISDDTFSNNDAIYFYIPEWDVWSNPYITVWLLQNQDGNLPLRITEPKNQNKYLSTEEGITLGESVASEKIMMAYNHRIPLPSENSRWYWQKIDKGFFKPISFTLEGVSNTSEPFDVELYFTNTAVGTTSIVDIYLNEKFVERASWKGIANYKFNKKLAASLFKNGENTLSFYTPVEEIEKQSLETFFIGYKIKYARELSTSSGIIDATVQPPKPSEQNLGYIIKGFNRGDITCFDVTNPQNIVSIPTNNRYTKSENAHIFDINYTSVEEQKKQSSPKHCIFFTKAAAKVPLYIKKYSLSFEDNLFENSNQYDIIMISHAKFLGDISAYAYYLKNKGFKVKTVDVEKIFDLFNYGEKKDQAIQNFLSYAYYNWKAPKIQYVLMVGEASDLPSLYNCHGEKVQEDLVPVFGYNDKEASVRSDSKYSLIAGNDQIPDIAIGRFSVNTPEELKTIINKNIDYEVISPVGNWRINHSFITDDEPEFDIIAETYIKCGVPNFYNVDRIYARDYSYQRFFRVFARKRSVECTDKIIDNFNNGMATCNYIGHGGPNIWSSERLFHILDIPQLQNENKLAFITSSSCDTGWLDYPEEPVKSSMGELFVKALNGGAIACFFPTSGGSPAEHQYLMTFLHNGINMKGLSAFGDAITYSKLLFHIYRKNPHLLDQYVLIGSPVEVLVFPQKIIPLDVTPEVVNLMKNEKIKIKGDAGKGLWGLGEVKISGDDKKDIFLSKSIRVADGQFEFESLPPEDLKPGVYNITFFAANESENKDAIGEKGIYLDKPNINLNVIVKNQKQLYSENEKVPIVVEVQNLSYLNIENVIMEILDIRAPQAPPILNQTFGIGAGKKKIVSLDWTAKAGVNYLNFRVNWKEGENEGDWQEKKIVFPVSPSSAEMAFDILAEATITDPDPLVSGTKPTFKFPLYNLGKQKITNLEINYFLGEDTQVGETKQLYELPQGDFRVVSFNSPTEFPEGKFKTILKVKQTSPEKTYTVPYIVDVKKRLDLIVVKDSVKAESLHFYPEETVYIYAKIKNISDIPAKNFYVEAFENIAWEREKVCSPAYPDYGLLINELKPGEEKDIKLRWDRSAGTTFPAVLYVIANSRKTIPENDYSNNVGSTRVKFRDYGNLVMKARLLNPEQTFIHRGSKVEAEYTLEVTGEDVFYNVPVDIYVNSPFEKPKNLTETITIPIMRPGEKITEKFSWEVSDFYTQLVFEVNKEKYIPESSFKDDRAAIDFDFLISDKYFAVDNEGKMETKYMFNMGKKQFLQLNPSYQLTPVKTQIEKLTETKLDKQYLKEPALEKEPDEDELRDNKWTFKDGSIIGSPFESPQPITFSIPVPDGSTTIYDLSLVVKNSVNYNGFPASKILAKIENDKNYRVLDYTIQKTPWTEASFYIGRIDTLDGYLDITFKRPEEQFWTIVYSVQLAPVVATYESPVIYMERKKFSEKFLLGEFISSAAKDNRISYQFRIGKFNDGKKVAWDDWKIIEEKTDKTNLNFSLPIEGNIFQWKAVFYKDLSNDFPSINGFKYKLTSDK